MSILKERIEVEQGGLVFLSSAFVFRMGLASMTFDQIRPGGILVADYFFVLSFLLLMCGKDRRMLKSRGSGVLAAGAIILCGAALSGVNLATIQVIALFGLFAPLGLVHSRNMRENLIFLMGGVVISCTAAIVAAVAWPGIADVLTIDPKWPTSAYEFGERYGGLAGHPMSLGLSAALAVLIGVGLLLSKENAPIRWVLLVQISLCVIGALLSGSRNFLASLVPALFVLAVWRPLSRRAVAAISCGVIFLIVSWIATNYVAPDLVGAYAERLSKTSADDNENSGRLLTAAIAVSEISQKPILGWGMDHFGEAGMMYLPQDGEYMSAHVNFLQYWYAMGILGAIGFALLFFLPVRRMLQILKRNPPNGLEELLKLGISVYLLLFIGSNVQPILLNRYFYMPLFLFAGLTMNMVISSRASLSVGRIAQRTPAPRFTAVLADAGTNK